jgi:hypothetical protein
MSPHPLQENSISRTRIVGTAGQLVPRVTVAVTCQSAFKLPDCSTIVQTHFSVAIAEWQMGSVQPIHTLSTASTLENQDPSSHETGKSPVHSVRSTQP